MMYADTLMEQEKDDEAVEHVYTLAISKGIELLGQDNPLVMKCKADFGQFLAKRARHDETERIFEEINKDLEKFMLDNKAT